MINNHICNQKKKEQTVNAIIMIRQVNHLAIVYVLNVS